MTRQHTLLNIGDSGRGVKCKKAGFFPGLGAWAAPGYNSRPGHAHEQAEGLCPYAIYGYD